MARPKGITSHRKNISMEQEYGIDKANKIKEKISLHPNVHLALGIHHSFGPEFKQMRREIQTQKYQDPIYKEKQISASRKGGFGSFLHAKGVNKNTFTWMGRSSKFSLFYRPDIELCVRSTYEANFVRVLNHLMVAFEYESKRCWFNLGNGTYYLCDFYLPELNLFIEVKPGKRERNMTESLYKPIKCVIKYPEITLKVLDRDGYLKLEGKYKYLLDNWEN